MKSTCRKEVYRVMHMKGFWIIALAMLLVALVPMTDWFFLGKSVLSMSMNDYLILLNCGGGMLMGFGFCCVLSIIVSVGLIFHSEFHYKTYFYEKMHGVSAIKSLMARFLISVILVSFIVVGILGAFLFCFFNNGGSLNCGVVDFVLYLLCFAFSAIQVSVVTAVAAMYFQSGYKAIMFSFVRYVVIGFVWSSIGGEKYYIQFQALDPFNAIAMAFAGDELIMNNYWIILSVVVLSLLINVYVAVLVLEASDKRRDY